MVLASARNRRVIDVGRELRVDHLDGDSAVERGIRREEDHAHAATPELPLEPVLRPERRLERGEEIDGRIAHVRDR